MSFLLGLILFLPALAVLAAALFLAAEVLASFGYEDPSDATASAARGRLAVVIPAHDEGAAVAATVADVRTQLRPGDRILVVADNCSDDTADHARAAGAETVERADPARRGKGYALQFGIDHLRADAPDIVVFIDADCRLGPGALERIAQSAQTLQRPVQALYLMNAPEGADPKASVSAFAWLLMNEVRMSGLQKLAGFSRLTGAGMAFPWPLIRDVDLASGEIVEDLALTLKMIDRGAAPLLDKRALVTSELARSQTGAATQRARWEHGSINMARRMAPGLLAKGFAGDGKALAMAFDLCIPPLTLLGALIVGGVIVSLAPALGGVAAPLKLCLWAGVVFALAVGVAWASYGRAVLPPAVLAGLWGYLLGKLKIYGREGRRSAGGWTRTDRGDDA